MKFEYKIETHYLPTVMEREEYLNQEGNDGWELIAFDPDFGSAANFHFKRAIKEENDE